MSEEELDGEIAKVGFDPKKEPGFGPGLRERVVDAIVSHRLKEEPPEGCSEAVEQERRAGDATEKVRRRELEGALHK